MQIDCESVELSEHADPRAFVISKNAHRRHLTASQRAAAVVTVNDWRERGGDHKKQYAPGAHCSPTAEKMAKQAGTSVRTIVQAKEAAKAGLSDAVRDGKVSVKRAAEIAKLPEEARQEASK